MKPARAIGAALARRTCAARGRGRQAGFSLIEVLVAFALLALGLALLLGSLSGAARQVRGSGDVSRASLHARSLLAQAGVGEVLAPGRREGTLEGGRYRWTLEIEPWTDPEPAAAAPPPLDAPRMLQLTLILRWGAASGQRLQWRSLRLAPAAGPTGQAPP